MVVDRAEEVSKVINDWLRQYFGTLKIKLFAGV